MKLCEEIGIPAPKSRLVKSPDELQSAAKELGYPKNPVVVKPPVSYGSRGFRVLREGSSWDTTKFLSQKPNATEISLEELLAILSRDEKANFPQLMVSEFLPGNEYSVDAFSGKKVSIAIPRLRKEIVNGISFRDRSGIPEGYHGKFHETSRSPGSQLCFWLSIQARLRGSSQDSGVQPSCAGNDGRQHLQRCKCDLVGSERGSGIPSRKTSENSQEIRVLPGPGEG